MLQFKTRENYEKVLNYLTQNYSAFKAEELANNFFAENTTELSKEEIDYIKSLIKPRKTRSKTIQIPQYNKVKLVNGQIYFE